MPEMRRSARLGNSSASPTSSPAKTGTKRKADASSPKEGKKTKKAQKTLEETMPEIANDAPKDDDVEMKDGGEVKEVTNGDVNAKGSDKAEAEGEEINGDVEETKTVDDASKAESKIDTTKNEADGDRKPSSAGAESESKVNSSKEDATRDVEGDSRQETEPQDKPTTKADDDSKEALAANTGDVDKPAQPEATDNKEANGTTHEKDDSTRKQSSKTEASSSGDLVGEKHARDDKVASSIIEKGIIYFFTRGRVDTENPEGVQDLQRTFFVLRPIPIGAKLGDGPIDDSKTNRLLALPKKVFPESGKDRFMTFVEKAKVSMSELKEQFFQGNDYETKAGGKRHTPAVMPVGEGVYAITEVDRSSHLAYMLTIPKEPGQLQDEIGIKEKGSFVLSLKNPKNKGPANTQLPQTPDFPESIMSDFRGLAWMPIHKSQYLDYANAQLLLIGESPEKFSGGEQSEKKESPEKELERLEGEDEIRVDALHGEDAVFKDLHISKGEYQELKTTW